MKRVLLLGLFLVAGAFAFESYSGRDLGVRRGFEMTKGAISGGFAGGYGMATDAGRSISGGASGLAGGVSANMGAAFGK